MANSGIPRITSRDTVGNLICNKLMTPLIVVACLTEWEQGQRIRFPFEHPIHVDDTNSIFLHS